MIYGCTIVREGGFQDGVFGIVVVFCGDCLCFEGEVLGGYG